MPRYIDKKKTATMNGIISGAELYPALYCAKSVEFFSTLSIKLVTMSESLKVQFDDLRRAALARCADGAVMAAIDAPDIPLGVGAEYFQYINLHGPPPAGQFDPDLLAKIRFDMGITVGV